MVFINLKLFGGGTIVGQNTLILKPKKKGQPSRYPGPEGPALGYPWKGYGYLAP